MCFFFKAQRFKKNKNKTKKTVGIHIGGSWFYSSVVFWQIFWGANYGILE